MQSTVINMRSRKIKFSVTFDIGPKVAHFQSVESLQGAVLVGPACAVHLSNCRIPGHSKLYPLKTWTQGYAVCAVSYSFSRFWNKK